MTSSTDTKASGFEVFRKLRGAAAAVLAPCSLDAVWIATASFPLALHKFVLQVSPQSLLDSTRTDPSSCDACAPQAAGHYVLKMACTRVI